MSFDRRKFLKITGITSAFLLIPGSMLINNNSFFDTNDLDLDELIAVHFGPSFKLIEISTNEGAFIAEIENHDNRFIVQSENLNDWKVLSSTIS